MAVAVECRCKCVLTPFIVYVLMSPLSLSSVRFSSDTSYVQLENLNLQLWSSNGNHVMSI